MDTSFFNSLRNVQFEDWKNHGVNIRACRAGADGIVGSAKVTYRKKKLYIYWDYTNNTYVIEND